MTLTRRHFTALAAGAAVPLPSSGFRVVSTSPLARQELVRGLNQLWPNRPISDSAATSFTLAIDPTLSANPEVYRIAASSPQNATLTGATQQALLYAIFDLLERNGAFFGIDGESYPLTSPAALLLPRPNEPWSPTPRFSTRGLLPWPDFLNCISVYNDEDFRAYFEAMLRMRFNTFGMHVYTGANQWAESYLSYEFAGAGHLAFLDNSGSHRWGYLPQRTSRYGMGAAQFYDSETFGSDATRLGRDPWEIADRTRSLLRRSLDYAHSLGLRTGVGFEPYQIPDEIWRALPPEVKPQELPGRKSNGARFDIESVTARKMLEARLGQLLEAYPNLDHVWLWEDENMNWESRKTGIPLSTTPFLQAHDFLRRHAPKKRLVLSGWGGVARHFEYFHKQLPGDVIFSCLSDSLGWDPIHEVFAKLDGRERWPIPWLEDDPGMWLPQFHVHRFQRDIDLAQRQGCQGMIGIHWRHRIVDPTAAYMARASWDSQLQPASHYLHYAHTQAAAARAPQLAAVLTAADKDRTLLSTGTFETKDGHVVTHEFTGDYNEAFTFWNNYEPAPGIVASQKLVAGALSELTRQAATPAERERLAYLAGHVEFLVPYTEAWTLAHRIQKVLDTKSKDKVRAEAVPLWLQLAPQVRQAILTFQAIVATRNDLGTLASMQNKFVRLALHRLPLSIQEYLGELPPEMESARQAALAAPASEAPRLIVPTRPTMLGPKDSTRVLAIASGSIPPANVHLYQRHNGLWQAAPMPLLGRRTFAASLTGAATAWYISARFGQQTLTAPPDAPHSHYRLTTL
jgi:hypothetical protein